MKVRIYDKPTSRQQKILREECVKEFDKMLAYYNREAALQVLHILRFDFGFGQKRLKRFSEKLGAMQTKTVARYEIREDDIPDICEIQLSDSGIDLKDLSL